MLGLDCGQEEDEKEEEDEEEEDDDDDNDEEYGYGQREEDISVKREPSDHHMIMNEDYDPAIHLPLEEDLMMEKDDDLELLREAEVGKEDEEDIANEDDSLSFLQRPPEEDDGTSEEQEEFVHELEKFFAERKMEYRHPKFYGENLNCLK